MDNTLGHGIRKDFTDRRVWDLSGYEANYIHLDYRFGFDCLGTGDRHGYLSITINVPFRLLSPDGEYVYDPEHLETIAGALRILHRSALTLTVYASRRLDTKFDGGFGLTVEKHAQYETWEARGQDELADIAFLCSPHDGPP